MTLAIYFVFLENRVKSCVFSLLGRSVSLPSAGVPQPLPAHAQCLVTHDSFHVTVKSATDWPADGNRVELGSLTLAGFDRGALALQLEEGLLHRRRVQTESSLRTPRDCPRVAPGGPWRWCLDQGSLALEGWGAATATEASTRPLPGKGAGVILVPAELMTLTDQTPSWDTGSLL